MDRSEPHWRINSSFSPPLPRRQQWLFHPDGLPHVTNGSAVYMSSASSQSWGSRSGVNREQYPDHHYSVSDGALPYYGSPSDNPLVPRWTPPPQRYDLGEFSTPSGGARPEVSLFTQSNEQQFAGRVPSVPSSFGSPSPLSDASQWASTSKPIFLPACNFSNRRSFMAKPVYPIVYGNPVSDGEIYPAPAPIIGSSTSTGSTHSPDLKFQKVLHRLQRMETSPDTNASSSRREGFRWSSASRNELGFDGDTIGIAEHISLENPRSPYINNTARNQKCALCGRPLWQKSPWSAHRLVRSGDMPVAGVLPCGHVFHADCLEESTPKSQIHEPPCPVCKKSICSESSASFSEPLQVALRSSRKNQGANVVADGAGTNDGDTRKNTSQPMPRRGGSLLKNHVKKRFSFKGKSGKDLVGAKMLERDASLSSSSSVRDNNQSQPRFLKFRQPPK